MATNSLAGATPSTPNLDKYERWASVREEPFAGRDMVDLKEVMQQVGLRLNFTVSSDWKTWNASFTPNEVCLSPEATWCDSPEGCCGAGHDATSAAEALASQISGKVLLRGYEIRAYGIDTPANPNRRDIMLPIKCVFGER